MKREEFDQRVQEAFDRRRDPVDDPAVREYALEHPEVLEELAGMRWAVGLFERKASGEPIPVRRERAWSGRAIGVAAAVLLLCSVLAILYLTRGNGSSEPPRPGGASRILWHRVTVTTESGPTRRVCVTGSDGWRASESMEIEPAPASGAIAMLGPTRIRTGTQGRDSR